MKMPVGGVEVYLQPGDFHFGHSKTRITTLLGSCISITLWHPNRLIGGMCHFMLPNRRKRSGELEGKYADEAMEMFAFQAVKHKTALSEYQVKLFGGGVMFPQHNKESAFNVSSNNVEAACALLAKYKLEPLTQDIGLTGHRRIAFDIWNGNVWVRYQPVPSVEKLGGIKSYL